MEKARQTSSEGIIVLVRREQKVIETGKYFWLFGNCYANN